MKVEHKHISIEYHGLDKMYGRNSVSFVCMLLFFTFAFRSFINKILFCSFDCELNELNISIHIYTRKLLKYVHKLFKSSVRLDTNYQLK